VPIGDLFDKDKRKFSRELKEHQKTLEERKRKRTLEDITNGLGNLFFDAASSLDKLSVGGEYEVIEHDTLYLVTYTVDGNRVWEYENRAVDLLSRGMVGLYNVFEGTFEKRVKTSRGEETVKAQRYHGLPLRKK